MVVVINHDQVAELQVTGGGGSLGGDTLHGTAITEEGVRVVVDQVETWLVEDSTSVSLGNGQTDGVSEALTKRSGGNLDTRGIVSLGVTGGDGVDLLIEKSGNAALAHCNLWNSL